MAPTSTKRQSRKRRKARPVAGAPGPRSVANQPAPRPGSSPAVSPTRRDPKPRRDPNILKAYGERPPSPFGGVPVAEVAILAGAIGVAVGLFGGQNVALIVGVIVCALGVAEFSLREHLSGYRSHATLLAGMLAIGVGVLMIAVYRGKIHRGPLLLAVVPVFGIAFWGLRKRFRAARQARIVRPPDP